MGIKTYFTLNYLEEYLAKNNVKVPDGCNLASIFESCDLYDQGLNEVVDKNGKTCDGRLQQCEVWKFLSKIAQFGEEILDAVRGCKKEVFAKEKNLYNKAIVLNNFFRDWGHQFIYDFETVEAMLKMCKFKTIKRCEIYKSDYNDLTNIESHGKIIGEAFNEMETMVIEAKK